MKIAKLLQINESVINEKFLVTDEAKIVDKVQRILNGKSWLIGTVMYDSSYNTINLVITSSKKPLLTTQYFAFEAQKKQLTDKPSGTKADLNRFLSGGSKISLYNPHKGAHLTPEIKEVIASIEEKVDAKCNIVLTTGQNYIDPNSPLAYAIARFDVNEKISDKLQQKLKSGIPSFAKLHSISGDTTINPVGEWRVQYEIGLRINNKLLRQKLAYYLPTRVSYLRGAEYTPEKLFDLFIECGEDGDKWQNWFENLKEVLRFNEDDWNGRNIVKVYVEGIDDHEEK